MDFPHPVGRLEMKKKKLTNNKISPRGIWQLRAPQLPQPRDVSLRERQFDKVFHKVFPPCSTVMRRTETRSRGDAESSSSSDEDDAIKMFHGGPENGGTSLASKAATSARQFRFASKNQKPKKPKAGKVEKDKGDDEGDSSDFF